MAEGAAKHNVFSTQGVRKAQIRFFGGKDK